MFPDERLQVGWSTSLSILDDLLTNISFLPLGLGLLSVGV
jgi:hypothetical protein